MTVDCYNDDEVLSSFHVYLSDELHPPIAALQQQYNTTSDADLRPLASGSIYTRPTWTRTRKAEAREGYVGNI